MEENKDMLAKVKEQVEIQINNILNEGFQPMHFENMYKLIDIHKDIANEEYWKKEGENMGYRGNYGTLKEWYQDGYNEGSYGRRGVAGTGRGRYREGGYNEGYNAGGNYGRRGVDAKYRGEEIMDDMYSNYQEYSEGKQNYGSDAETLKSFEYMLKSFKDYYKHLKKEASSPEEIELLEQTAREIGMI